MLVRFSFTIVVFSAIGHIALSKSRFRELHPRAPKIWWTTAMTTTGGQRRTRTQRENGIKALHYLRKLNFKRKTTYMCLTKKSTSLKITEPRLKVDSSENKKYESTQQCRNSDKMPVLSSMHSRADICFQVVKSLVQADVACYLIRQHRFLLFLCCKVNMNPSRTKHHNGMRIRKTVEVQECQGSQLLI